MTSFDLLCLPRLLLQSIHRPYIKDAQKILTRAREYGNPRIAQTKLNFLHLAIIDGSITTDSAISKLAEDCCDRVRAGEKLYIHCWGGHGRTGTLVSTNAITPKHLHFYSAIFILSTIPSCLLSLWSCIQQGQNEKGTLQDLACLTKDGSSLNHASHAEWTQPSGFALCLHITMSCITDPWPKCHLCTYCLQIVHLILHSI